MKAADSRLSWIGIKAEFVMPAAQVLHEHMPSTYHPRAAESLKPRIGLSQDFSRP